MKMLKIVIQVWKGSNFQSNHHPVKTAKNDTCTTQVWDNFFQFFLYHRTFRTAKILSFPYKTLELLIKRWSLQIMILVNVSVFTQHQQHSWNKTLNGGGIYFTQRPDTRQLMQRSRQNMDFLKHTVNQVWFIACFRTGNGGEVVAEDLIKFKCN